MESYIMNGKIILSSNEISKFIFNDLITCHINVHNTGYFKDYFKLRDNWFIQCFIKMQV